MLNKLVWPITLLLCVGITVLGSPAIIRAVKEPTVLPAPVVVLDYTAKVQAACAGLTDEARDYAATQYKAMQFLCDLPNQPKNDGEYQEKLELIRTAYYGDAYPFKDEMKPLHDVAFAEAENRGLIAAPWDKAKWKQLATDTLAGVLHE